MTNVLLGRQVKIPPSDFPDDEAPAEGYWTGTIIRYQASSSRKCAATWCGALLDEPHPNPKCRNGARWEVDAGDETEDGKPQIYLYCLEELRARIVLLDDEVREDIPATGASAAPWPALLPQPRRCR